jgi:exodeoxyribonuclease VII large subunit
LRRALAEDRRRLMSLAARLTADRAMAVVKRGRDRVDQLDRLRMTLGYEATLQRGFAIVRGDGAVVSSVTAAAAAGEIELQFADGRLAVGRASRTTARQGRKLPERGGSGQGSLL